MKINVVMPQMGESITEGTLIKWHKKKGDMVKKDEIIYEIATDKVDTEIPSPEDGVLADIKVFEQETVKVGTVVAILETNGETILEKDSAPSPVEVRKTELSSTTQVGGEIIDIPMPKMGESVMEGTIIKWHKKVGDKVNCDEIIFEISTDKVDTEVPSPADGTLVEILHQENETVAVGEPVAKISTSGGIVRPKAETKDQEQDFGERSTETTRELSRAGQDQKAKTFQPSTVSSNRFYSPLVLNIARTEGISMSELETIPGTGIGGRLSKNDLLQYIQRNKTGAHALPKIEKISGEKEKTVTGQRTEIIPMDNNRKRVMQHMLNSRDTSVHVTAMIEVDMTKIYNFIEKNRDAFAAEGIKLTYMPFVSFAAIKGLKEFPLVNASIDGDNIVLKKYINLGIAVAVEPNGLIVPNIKNADEKNIRGLAKSIADISNRARSKKLVPDDIADGTFSITNYGVFGSLFGTPIINQPEVAILGVGTVTKKPVVVEQDGVESIAIKPMMYLSLSHDHRLVDGMLGGRFLKFVKEVLENFDTNIV